MSQDSQTILQVSSEVLSQSSQGIYSIVSNAGGAGDILSKQGEVSNEAADITKDLSGS